MEGVQSITVADGPANQDTRGQGELSLLVDPHHIRADLRTLARAVKERWPVHMAARRTTIARLIAIIRKETVMVPTTTGAAVSEAQADANAVSAAKVLTAMMAQNQRDEHAEAGIGEGKGATTNVLQIFNVPPPRVLGGE